MTLRNKHLIAYAAAMLALMLLQLLFWSGPLATLSDFDTDIVYTLLSQILCMGIVPLGTLFLLNRGKISSEIKIMRYKPPRDKKACIFLSLGMMALIMPFTLAFSYITNLIFAIIGYKRSIPAETIYLGTGDLFLMLTMTALLPAIFEEFSHRGLLLSGLENRGSEHSAVVISAVMFGLMHQNPGQMIYAVFGGLVFGVAVVKTDSIIPAMCAHFANNAISVILQYSSQKGNALGVWYEKLLGRSDILSVGVILAVMIFSVFAMVRLLQYIARKAPKPISETKLLGVVTLDAFKPDGKATLKDNAFLIATFVAESSLLLALVAWGIGR